jgi:hypothetical protein
MKENRITVHDGKTITVWYVPGRRLIHHKMHGFCAGEDIRKALMAGLEALRENRAIKWLSDDRLNGALPPDDLKWAMEEWFPAVVKAGWKYWAIVAPAEVIGQMNMKRIMKIYADQGVTTQMFTDPDPASAWLDTFFT